MAKPIDTERRQKIVQYVMSRGKARVAELAGAFNVSGETIRKDLNELHNRNILHKGHGIVLPASAYLENVYARKAARHQEEKSRIAALAESLIPSEGVIYLDASSTVARLASARRQRQSGYGYWRRTAAQKLRLHRPMGGARRAPSAL